MAMDAIQSVSGSAAGTNARALDALRALGRAADLSMPDQALDAARKLVSELFFKPMLEQMRAFPLGQEIGGGGRGEAVFGERLDERVADVVANTSLRGFTESIAAKLMGGAKTSGSDATNQATAAPDAANPLNFLHALWPTQQAVVEKEGIRDDA